MIRSVDCLCNIMKAMILQSLCFDAHTPQRRRVSTSRDGLSVKKKKEEPNSVWTIKKKRRVASVVLPNLGSDAGVQQLHYDPRLIFRHIQVAAGPSTPVQ